MAVLVAIALIAAPANAATCSYPASAYSTGAPADVSSPGPQPVNDPVFPDQWGLTQIKAPAAWSRGDRGAGVTIAIVDTGIDLSHPDLAANIAPGGTDLTAAAAQGCPGPQDENGHGTHVAGIAAAVTNNGIGVAGTAPDAKVMPVRVLDASGSGDDPTVINGIKYAADHGAKVINLSLGGQQIVGETPALNQDIANAVQYAYSKGAVVVAAAGNETIPLCSYPAAAANAVCVGATDKRGLPSYYSNFPASTENAVGVRAPGGVGDPIACEDSEDIWSTVWPGASFDCSGSGALGGYDTLAGTSMATPYVSGVAALLAGKGLSNGQILECLKDTSSNGGSYDPVMGYGIVDADTATSKCSKASTPSFSGGGPTGGGGSATLPAGARLKVSAHKTRRARRIRVTVKSSAPVRVKLRAVRRKHTIGRKTVRLKKKGTRHFTMRLKRRDSGKVRLRWSGGGRKGVVTVRHR